MQPLTIDQIRTLAPSVFANNPSPRVSDRYAFIPTAAVVEQMMTEGWGVRMASESYSRIADTAGYQKHMIRFARFTDMENRNVVGSMFPEVVLTNSHNGLSKYQLHAGIFRLVCSNGMVVASSTFANLSVRHTGSASEIIGASYEILESTPKIMNEVRAMQHVTLNDYERKAFALGGAMARYGFTEVKDSPIEYTRLLDVKRIEDKEPTLWNTLNVVQENLVKGRQNIRKGEAHVTPEGRYVRPTRTRAIKAVDTDLKVNKSLWQMANEILVSRN